MNENEVRVIEWLQPRYEGAYTQYTIQPTHVDPNTGEAHGYLFIVQISTRNNMARAMQPAEPHQRMGKVSALRKTVQSLIDNRVEDGGARELS